MIDVRGCLSVDHAIDRAWWKVAHTYPCPWQYEATRLWLRGEDTIMILGRQSGRTTCLKVLAQIEYGSGKHLLDK